MISRPFHRGSFVRQLSPVVRMCFFMSVCVCVCVFSIGGSHMGSFVREVSLVVRMCFFMCVCTCVCFQKVVPCFGACLKGSLLSNPPVEILNIEASVSKRSFGRLCQIAIEARLADKE